MSSQDLPESMENPSLAERRWAALSHLGVPIYGPILPLILWAMARDKPFQRRHARSAFTLQIWFLVVWTVVFFVLVSRNSGFLVLPLMLVVVLGLELVEVSRALRSRPPILPPTLPE